MPSSAYGWEGEIRARYTVDETGKVQNLRLYGFGDDAPRSALQAVADSIGNCKFDGSARDAPVAVTQFIAVAGQNSEIVGGDRGI